MVAQVGRNHCRTREARVLNRTLVDWAFRLVLFLTVFVYGAALAYMGFGLGGVVVYVHLSVFLFIFFVLFFAPNRRH